MKWNAYWYGVAASDSAKLMKLQMSITGSTKEMALQDQRDFMKELKDEGLSASKVMADMAGHSEFIAKYMKDGGENMEAAAKYAASLGMDLGVAESMADKLLDFESSINAEMEASMLLGRSINLDKARQFAYQGKIEEMMREAKIQAGGEAAFAKMSVVQREALGDAIGISGANLAEFIKTEDGAAKAAEGLNWWWVALAAVVGGIAGLLISIIPAIIASTGVGAPIAAALQATATGTMVTGAAIGAGLGGTITAGALAMASGRASGGPVKAGNPYVVGEKRPELFIPSQAGHILPNVPQMEEGSGATFSAVDGQAMVNAIQTGFKENMQVAEQLARTSDRKREGMFANI
jgi:hypothetical protein